MSISKKKRLLDLILFKALIKIRNTTLLFLDLCGINDLFRSINRKKMVILFYHGITEKNFTFQHRRYIPKSIFKKQIIYLRRKRYEFITLTDWINILKYEKKIKNRYIILTFDDGNKNIVEQAYPIMKKYGAKGCFYVISSIIGNNKLLWVDYLDVLMRNHEKSFFKFRYKGLEYKYYLTSEENLKKAYGDIKKKLRSSSNIERLSYLKKFNKPNNIFNFKIVPKDYLIVNWDDLNTLDKNLLEIGCHSKTHPNLNLINNEDEFFEELYESKINIEENIQYSIDHFCYPSGFYNENIVQYLIKYGYLTGTTVNEGLNSIKTDLFQLKRIKVNNELIIFKFKVSGLYYFIKNAIKKYIPNKYLIRRISKFFRP